MGAWDKGAWDNDTGLDWLESFLDDPGLERLEAALRAAILAKEHLDAAVAEESLAAIELIAWIRGRPNATTFSDARLDQIRDLDLDCSVDRLVVAAASAVTDEANSELHQIWAGDEEWLEIVRGSVARAVPT